MKCVSCGNKYPIKHANRCTHLKDRLCYKCSLEGKGKHVCDLTCQGSLFPALKSFPLSTAIVGLPVTGERKATTEEFVPRGFHFVTCSVRDISISLKSMYLLTFKTRFILKGNSTLLKSLYAREGWKILHIEDAVKEYGNKVETLLAPTFSIFLNGISLRILPQSLLLKIANKPALVLHNNTNEFISTPDCFPPQTETPKPQAEKYSYLLGKIDTFYTPFVFNQEYELSFQIEAFNFIYEMAYYFPFRYVDFENFNLSSDASAPEIAIKKQRLLSPFRFDVFPPRQEYEWERHRNAPAPLRPWIRQATPFRKVQMEGIVRSEKEIPADGKINLSINDYSALQSNFWIKFPKGKELLSKVQITDSPLPVRIYDQLEKLPQYRNFLISFDIINFSPNEAEVELISEIKGYTDRAITTVKIPGHHSDESARQFITQCPILKRGVIKKITNKVKATLYYKIILKKNNKRIVVDRNTKIVELLPGDMIVWTTEDQKGSAAYDLSKMIAAWITPNDSGGIMDKIRGKAKDFHPQKILAGIQQGSTLIDINRQMKAIFDYLNEKSGISYVNQAFCYTEVLDGQRVLTPERVVAAKTGNCIDLVILFASLMEGLGINPLIMLMPKHAFLAWGNEQKTDEMGFLECTTIGRVNQKTGEKYTFDEAFEIGKQEFQKNFLFRGEKDFIPIYSLRFSPNKCQIINVSQARQEGISRSNF